MSAQRLRFRMAPLWFAALLALPAAVAAPAPAPASRPRIGLALSGGGARGVAHVGVLQVLEEHRIPVDCIAGTSMGAVVGGLYASGLPAARLDSVVREMDWLAAFSDDTPRAQRTFRRKRDDDRFLVKHRPGVKGTSLRLPPSLLDGQRIDLILKRLTLPVVTVRDFDRLATPYRAVAAELVSGLPVVLDHGDLALAMRASMSIPGAFAPREVDGRLLVDGGIIDNFPIEVARSLGAEVVIAVDIAMPRQKREELTSIPAIMYRLSMVASDHNRDRQERTLSGRDVLIRPDLGSITIASFDRAADAIAIGRRAAEAALASLQPLAVSEEAYAALQAERAARAGGDAPVIDSLRSVNHSRLGEDAIAFRIGARTGERLDAARLERGIDQVFGLGLFESVYYDVVPGPHGNALVITSRERAWGPDYLQAGVAVFEDFERPGFNLALAYSGTAVNRRNGEWSAGVQVGQEPAAWGGFFQPLDRGLRTFVDLELGAVRWPLNVFDTRGHKLSELGINQFGATLSCGRELGSWGEARAGILRGGGHVAVRAGDPASPTPRIETGEVFAQLFVDELDGVAFPRSGGSLRLRGSMARAALGSAVDFDQVIAEGVLAGSRGRSAGLVGGTFAVTGKGDAPLEARPRLGGLWQLSGFEQDERIGPHALLLRAALYRRLTGLLPVWAGLSAEHGNVFASRSEMGLPHGTLAGSVFLGVDTPLGPACAAYGRAEGGRSNYYLALGHPLGGRRPGVRIR